MAGPWEQYAASPQAEAGPWTQYAPSPAKKKRGLLGDIGQTAGNAAAGLVRGAGSIGATILAPYDMAMDAMDGKGFSLESNRARRAGIDGGLRELGAETDSTTYQVGKLAGEIAGTAGAGGVVAKALPFAPGLANAVRTGGFRAGTPAAASFSRQGLINGATRTAGGAIAGGATAGLVDPESAGMGAGIGAALPGAAKVVGMAGRTAGKGFQVGEQNRALADTAINKYGLPLGYADIAEGGTVKALRSMLNDAPFVGGIGNAQRDTVQEGFNKAVGGTFGAPETKLTTTVIDQAKKRMGDEFDRIWNNNVLSVDGQLFNQLDALKVNAAKLPQAEGQSLMREIDDVFSKMQAGPNGEAFIPGDVANKFQSYLRRRADGSAGLKNELGDLRKNMIDAFNRSVDPADAAALTQNRTQYKAFKTVEPLLNSAEAGVAGRMPGDVPAGLLSGAVARGYSNAGTADLGELAQIGSRFLVDRTSRTGGSMRAALQNTAVGTALVGGGLTNPLLAMGAIPTAAGVNALLGMPGLGRMAVNGAGNNRLMQLLAPERTLPLAYRTAPVLSDQ